MRTIACGCLLLATLITGCTYYSTAPGVYTTTPTNSFLISDIPQPAE
jgi:hypothetical protein